MNSQCRKCGKISKAEQASIIAFVLLDIMLVQLKHGWENFRRTMFALPLLKVRCVVSSFFVFWRFILHFLRHQTVLSLVGLEVFRSRETFETNWKRRENLRKVKKEN